MDGEQSSEIIAALEVRLSRLEYHLTGHVDSPMPYSPSRKGNTPRARLMRLERGLDGIASRSHTIRQLLELQSAYPELFFPSFSSGTALTTSEKLAIVNASATAFHETASRLTMLKDLPIPSTSSSAQIVSLATRIEQLQRVQQSQKAESHYLRARSARAISQWHELGVLGTGECWAEWEGRLEAVEKQMRRRERDFAAEQRNGEAYQE